MHPDPTCQLHMTLKTAPDRPFGNLCQRIDGTSPAPGHLFRETVTLKPGITMALSDYPADREAAYRFEIDQAPLSFSFFLSGSHQLRIQDRRGQHQEIRLAAGKSTISFFPQSRGEARHFPSQPVRSLVIFFDPKWLMDLLGSQCTALSPELVRILHGEGGDSFFQMEEMTPQMQVAVQQLLQCPYHGPLKTIYMESKATELLTLRVARLLSPNTKPPTRPGIRPEEERQIRQAEAILTSDLQIPPTLFELARAVGLSHPRLNQGFRQMYGDTVFGYLRSRRLEQARALLEDPALNITEVAYACGFSSPSHFAAAFAKAYACRPGQYRSRYQPAP